MTDQGSDNRNPWARPPQGGQKRNPWGGSSGGGHSGGSGDEPNFDELFKRFSESFKDFMPGDGGNGRFIILGAVAGVALWLASGLYIVQPGEHAVIQRFGAWNRTQTEEGLGYRIPAPIESMTKVTVSEIRRMNIGFVDQGTGREVNTGARADIPEESLMLTFDRNIVDLDLVIQWDIKSAEDFVFNVRDQEATIKKVAESAIREAVGRTQMFPVITTERESVAQQAKQIIQNNLDAYHSGVNITQVLIQSAEVHPDVQDAFQDVQSAKQDAEDVQNRARAYREDILPKARGQAIQMVQEAEGYKQSTISKSQGDAERFNSIYQAYLNGEDVTRQRLYIEAMESVLMNAQKIILDDQGKGQGVVPYLPLDQLNRVTPASGSQDAPAPTASSSNTGATR
ncbi:MAG: FtsH protease activity modulator HflK [Alphaproteobacteria bacterium]|nr:FtsH protease activity modulator HflK [Alphaproteobacteria bacterium]